MTDILKGSRAGELPRPNRVYAEGRVCEEDGCETKLSRYNRSKVCWQHTPITFPVNRGDRKKKNGSKKARVAA